ncbi:hypothetical protein MC885_005206 [Smutsia gigantea]|nr:hypothetical protein MC885_005206 [Smutsia gigantea]
MGEEWLFKSDFRTLPSSVTYPPPLSPSPGNPVEITLDEINCLKVVLTSTNAELRGFIDQNLSPTKDYKRTTETDQLRKCSDWESVHPHTSNGYSDTHRRGYWLGPR